MNEDISAQYRLGISILILGSLLMIVISLMYMGMALMTNMLTKYGTAVYSVPKSTALDLSNCKNITAPLAYKFVQSNFKRINKVEIKYLNGTTSDNAETLMEHATSGVTLQISESPDNTFAVLIEEVSEF